LIAHFDWDSQLFDGSDVSLVRRLVHAYADWQQPWMTASDPWMGRRLWRTIKASGLFKGAVYALPLINREYESGAYGWELAQCFRALAKRGLAEAVEVEEFLDELQSLQDRGEYFYSISMFAFVGQAV
jgi:hypothetical protein